MQRRCAHCNSVLVKRDDEPQNQFLKRLSCNLSCRAKFQWRVASKQRLALVNKVCAHCGKPMTQRVDEPNRNWLRRKTCSRACATTRKGTQHNAAPVAGNTPTPNAMPLVTHLDVLTRQLFLEAIELHPDLLFALAKREFNSLSAATSVAHSRRQ